MKPCLPPLCRYRLLACALSSLPLLSSRVAQANDDPLAERRATIELAEEELRLRERDASVKARERALQSRASSGPTGTSFARSGRVVFPELAGISSYALLGVPGLAGGIGASGVLSYGASSSEVGGSRTSTSTLAFSPAADVFVTDQWTVGLSATAARFESVSLSTDAAVTPSANMTGYSLMAEPRVGRAFDLGPLTLWPKLGVGYGIARSQQDARAFVPASRTISRTVTSQLAVDAVFPLSRHVIFDLGPSVTFRHSDVTNNSTVFPLGDDESVAFGMQAHLGLVLP